uniref:Cytochrome P450 4X1-like isoform X1 n=1 Tax=Phascolarctos cinereus TaxID=38626 RepID=A0A6P5KEB3_PHACI|nr:cytochrome P450 4X1-like isoform X1 [Phascolarctos cinereus]
MGSDVAPSWLETHWARPLHLALTFTLALLLLQVVKLYLRRQGLLRALRLFPGPPTHWLYGNQKEFYLEKELQQFDVLVEKYPCAFPRWVGAFQVLLNIYDPEYAKILLNRRDPKIQLGHKFIVPWVGRGLLSLEGKKWYQHRHLLTPAFHFSILKPYIHVMNDSACRMLFTLLSQDTWEKLSTQDSSEEICEPIRLMTLDSIMKCAFGVQTSSQTESFSTNYLSTVTKLSELIFCHLHSYHRHNDLIYRWSSQGQEFQALCQTAHHHLAKIIQERREAFKNESEQDKIQKKKSPDFLDIVLCAKSENVEGLSDEELEAELNTFVFGGLDTTASSLCWLFYCMAMNPEHQHQCREEIRGILKPGDTITWDHLDQMSYSTMCIKEALRLYPPDITIARKLSKPITFPDGRSLPTGMIVVLNIWALHHNPAVWENPQVFDPQRFCQENSMKRHSYAFLPFSAGPRNCIGQQFAMLQLKVVLALTLLRFELLLDPKKPPIPIPHLALRSKNGIHLYLKPFY